MWAWLIALLAIVKKGASKRTPLKSSRAPAPTVAPRGGPPALSEPVSWASIPSHVVVERTLAQRGRGRYRMGGGAIFTAPDVYAPDGNNYPGTSDCTGLLAYAGMYRKGPYNTDAIVKDAKGEQRRFYIVPDDEPVRPGDFLITDRGVLRPDHAAVIVDVLPSFVRHGPKWWEGLRVAHSLPQVDWSKGVPEQMEDRTGAVRVTDAYRWRHEGVIVRAHHITD